jgi:DNA-binding LytR/AlgR family response regulator
MQAIAIDDEPLALEVIKAHAEKVVSLDLLKTYSDPWKAMEFLQSNPVDLLFLDIKMPDISGIDLFEGLTHKPMVIFTTAYPDFATKGFDLDAIDYLLKPFSLPRFIKACNKALDRLAQKEHFPTREAPKFIFLKSGYEQFRVHLDQIIYLEATGNYVSYQIKDGSKVVCRSTMSDAISQLPETTFLKVHRSFAIALRHLNKIEKNQVNVAGFEVPIGESFKAELLEKIS